jgi:HD-GYP domain-containing protein (c-di-GMP phosphodiesterase class II)
MSPEGALTELRAHSGTQFDPNVIDALVRVLGAAPTEAPIAS